MLQVRFHKVINTFSMTYSVFCSACTNLSKSASSRSLVFFSYCEKTVDTKQWHLIQAYALFAFITIKAKKLHTAHQHALHFSGCQEADLILCKETSHHTCVQTETDSLVKGCWGNVSQQPSDSSGILSPDTVSGMCSLISRLGQASTHGGRDWQFTACFQGWLDEWLKQHDGQLYNTDRVTEGWQATPWQKGRKKTKTNPRTELLKAN